MDAKRFARLPLVKWAAAYERLTEKQRMEIDDEAAELATRLARLSAYVSRRVNGGRHEDAVKAQNRVARRVRKALGFTYPSSAEVTF